MSVPEKFEVHFLSSGSSGNCTLLRTHLGAVVIDFGLAPGKFLEMIRPCGIRATYSRERRKSREAAAAQTGPCEPLRAALVTHLHGDHFATATLKLLLENEVHVYVHRDHIPEIAELASFQALRERGLLTAFSTKPFCVLGGMLVQPLRLPHDSTSTQGFVIECAGKRLGYAADLGHVTREVVDSLRECDLLALEFNHDEAMERESGRHPRHIYRVLGLNGHLSNDQAQQAVRTILCTGCERLRCLALLHLSRDCNTPALAMEAARAALRSVGSPADVVVTRQREYAGFVDLCAPWQPPVPLQAHAAKRAGTVRTKIVHVPLDLFDHEPA